MKNAARAKWIAQFDMENLVSSILQNGMLISISLVMVTLVVPRVEDNPRGFGSVLQARSLPLLFWADLRQLGVPGAWPTLLLHLSVAVLLVTPYLRVMASMVYFAGVERNWRHALVTGFVLAVLTITLLTNLV